MTSKRKRPADEPARITLRDVWDRMDQQDTRLRRIEYIVIALSVATVSPKAGGPSLPEVGAFLTSFFT